MTLITLTVAELQMAEKYAKMRRDANRQAGTTDQAYIKGETADLVGTKGEIAASLATGIPWINRFTPPEQDGGWLEGKLPDLSTDIEVRTTRNANYGIVVHKHNHTDWRYLLVHQLAYNKFDVVGWQHGHVIKQEKYWNADLLSKPVYIYPRRLLRPIGELEWEPMQRPT